MDRAVLSYFLQMDETSNALCKMHWQIYDWHSAVIDCVLIQTAKLHLNNNRKSDCLEKKQPTSTLKAAIFDMSLKYVAQTVFSNFSFLFFTLLKT